MLLWNCAILIFILKIGTKAKGLWVPVFRIEPPWQIEFSNINGTEIQCSADGVPKPKISWQTSVHDGAIDVPGLRYIRSDGTLVFSPFAPTDYNKEIHDTFYHCTATNIVRSVVSRKIHVRGVINQAFHLEVNNVYVGSGDTAVLKCFIPTFVEKYVSVDSWIRNDDYLLKMTDTNSSYTVLFTGELLLYDIKDTDSVWGYRCQTRNRLSGEIITSTTEAKIYVSGTHSSTLPTVILKKDNVSVEEDSAVQLPCVAKGNPSPTYRWMKDVNGELQPVKEDSRIWLVQGTLNIQKVYGSDAGKYQCIVRNSIGERRIESALIVGVPPRFKYNKQEIVTEEGNNETLKCHVIGDHPITISWQKDRSILEAESNHRYFVPNISRKNETISELHIFNTTRSDSGKYTCVAVSDIGRGETIIELKVKEVKVPSRFKYYKQEIVTEEGNNETLKCHVIGDTPVTISWQKGKSIVEAESNPRYLFRNISTKNETISELHVFNTTKSDSGTYTCVAVSDMGRDETFIELKVRGSEVTFSKEQIPTILPPRCRSMLNFSNRIGAILPCTSSMEHMTNMRWYTSDGVVTDVPGLRYVDIHGILWLRSFNSKDFNKNIHQNTYQCAGTTAAGKTEIISETCINAVIEVGEIKNDPPPFLFVTTTQRPIAKMVVPPRFIWSSQGIVTEEGQNETLICHAIGDSPIRISWQKNNSIVEVNPRYSFRNYSTKNETISELRIIHTTRSDEGDYACVASNKAGFDLKRIYLEMMVSYGPRDVKVQSGGPQAMLVTWKAPLDDQEFGSLKAYTVGFRKAGTTEPFTYKHVEHYPDKEIQSINITGLHKSVSYEIDVKIYDSEFERSKFNKTIETTAETVLPTTPTILNKSTNDTSKRLLNPIRTIATPVRYLTSEQRLRTLTRKNVTLTCRVNGDSPKGISWQKNKSIIEVKSNSRYFIRNYSMENKTISELEIIHTTRSDSGKYTCMSISKTAFTEKTIYLEVRVRRMYG